jgi:hypothetical protein
MNRQMQMEEGVVFSERQPLKIVWLRAVLFVLLGGLVLLFGWGMFTQLVLGQTWGDKPMSDTMLVLVSVFVIGLWSALSWAILRVSLVVKVDETNLHIAVWPFVRRTVGLAQITTAEAQKIRPLLQFAGVGARLMRGGWAYIVGGDRGVMMSLTDGKKVFVGSDRPEELVAAIMEGKSKGWGA